MSRSATVCFSARTASHARASVANGPSVFSALGSASVPDHASLPFGDMKKSAFGAACGPHAETRNAAASVEQATVDRQIEQLGEKVVIRGVDEAVVKRR